MYAVVVEERREGERGVAPSFVSWSRPSSCGHSWRSSGLRGEEGAGDAQRTEIPGGKVNLHRLTIVVSASYRRSRGGVIQLLRTKVRIKYLLWYCVYKIVNVL